MTVVVVFEIHRGDDKIEAAGAIGGIEAFKRSDINASLDGEAPGHRAEVHDLVTIADGRHIAVEQAEVERAIQAGLPADVELAELAAGRRAADTDVESAVGFLGVIARDGQRAGGEVDGAGIVEIRGDRDSSPGGLERAGVSPSSYQDEQAAVACLECPGVGRGRSRDLDEAVDVDDPLQDQGSIAGTDGAD